LLVASVSLREQTLKPFLITTCRVGFRDPEPALRREEFQTFKTNQGYMTTPAMTAYLREVLEIYAWMLRRERVDPPLPIYLLMDNHESYNQQEILDQIRFADIIPIWLPAHSSHSLQVLDVGLFGAYKTNYRNVRTRSTKPKFEGKRLGTLKACYTTVRPVTIWNA
jgi:hypothetical protein